MTLFSSLAFAQDTVEINGDVVEYSVDGNTVTAKGDVDIRYQGSRLLADEVDFSRDTNIAHARGHVRLITDQGEIQGDKLTFDYNTMKGDLNGAKLVAPPYYGGGRYVARVSETQMTIRDGYITTSDFDKPEYRIASKKIEIYPGDKLIARGVTLKLGSIPIFYLPKFSQSLKDRRPWFVVTPGRSKEWGEFLLTRFNLFASENLKGTVHLDYRTKLGLAEGLDIDYNTKKYGYGVFKGYYTQERRISEDHFWEKREFPTVERQKYKLEWRHKWDIDKTTTAIGQFFKITDPNFIKDYFERENERDPDPKTYFLLTKVLPYGIVGLRSDVRINRYNTEVERLPELTYDLPGTELYDSNIYWKSVSSFSSLTKELPAPNEFRPKTVRFDTDNELSYPMKVSIIEFKPFIGSRETYYSRTRIPTKGDAFRGQLKTGAILSTKFYRIFDAEMDLWGMEINRLRHIITPSIRYDYQSRPTVDSADLDEYDSVDVISRKHAILFSLENKLQTKRNDQAVDLLRTVVEVDFPLKEDPLGSGFHQLNADIDFHPTDWLSLYFDSSYNLRRQSLEDANVDLYLHGGNKWRLGIGKRFTREVDDILTTDLYYKINPKWAFKVYNRINVANGDQKEFDLVLTRDLHSWEMDIQFNEKRGEGSEILLVFRLKGFPDIGFDVGTSYNQRKPGSQE